MQTTVTLEPFWLKGSAGNIFCLSFLPSSKNDSNRGLLIIPPFGEEMNKCRRMMSLAGRAAAMHGCRALLVDLYGTGDSSGDFGDARLDRWLADLSVAASQLLRFGATLIDVIAVRSGALLLDRSLLPSGAAAGRLVLWQPVVDGTQYMKQFLRLKLAASILEGASATTMSGLMNEINASGSLEIAGYRLSNDLKSQMEHRHLRSTLPAVWNQIAWFEVGPSESETLGPASSVVADGLEDRGHAIKRRTLVGELFWGTPEIGVVPSLIDSTTQYLCPRAQ